MLDGRPPAETVALLWDCVLQTVPGDRRAGMVLDADSRNLQMRQTDYGLARRVLPDLVTQRLEGERARRRSGGRRPARAPGAGAQERHGAAALGHRVGGRRRQRIPAQAALAGPRTSLRSPRRAFAW